MPLFHLTHDSFDRIDATRFDAMQVRERRDLQRLLRSQLDVIAPECMLLAEEFSSWEDSRRRIDLLAIDKHANLVVIELKRSDDGGHLDLQALRYAAMVSTMTFEQAVDAHVEYLRRNHREDDARAALLDFLEWDDSTDGSFAETVRIVLVSADFSKEITTTVLWLNDEHGMDIHCVRLRPYAFRGEMLVDVQQIIPLPEAAQYQVQLRERKSEERAASGRVFDQRRWFCGDDDLLHVNGRTYAVSNQWGTTTETVLRRLAQSFPKAGVVLESATE
jgi:hypothetical protein